MLRHIEFYMKIFETHAKIQKLGFNKDSRKQIGDDQLQTNQGIAKS